MMLVSGFVWPYLWIFSAPTPTCIIISWTVVVCYPGYFDIFACFPSFAVLVCRKNAVTIKCCLQVTICLEDKIFPQIRNTILTRELSCVEGCNTGFNEAHPSSHFSCMTMVFCFFWWSRGNRVRIMRWPNIFKIQWLYWDDLRPEFLIANQDNTNRFCFRFEKGQAAMTTSVEPTNLDPLKSFKCVLAWQVALSFVGPSTAVACKNTVARGL